MYLDKCTVCTTHWQCLRLLNILTITTSQSGLNAQSKPWCLRLVSCVAACVLQCLMFQAFEWCLFMIVSCLVLPRQSEMSRLVSIVSWHLSWTVGKCLCLGNMFDSDRLHHWILSASVRHTLIDISLTTKPIIKQAINGMTGLLYETKCLACIVQQDLCSAAAEKGDRLVTIDRHGPKIGWFFYWMAVPLLSGSSWIST